MEKKQRDDETVEKMVALQQNLNTHMRQLSFNGEDIASFYSGALMNFCLTCGVEIEDFSNALNHMIADYPARKKEFDEEQNPRKD